MKVRLTHIDGKLPNLALMKLAHWHQSQGDEVHLSRTPTPTLFEPEYERVYASAIFEWSKPTLDRVRLAYPDAIVGGTGSETQETVENLLELPEYEHYDYSIYPDYPYSIGFTQRGCRLNCGFCVVPKKEGKPRAVNTIPAIHRTGSPKCVVLLDNDFFGQGDDNWKSRISEMDGFKVSFNQGINIRMITPESASALASIQYYDDQFKKRRIYTAWDNLGHERIFFQGLQMLNQAGIPSAHVMVYMLIGYKKDETFDEIMYRFTHLKDAGCMPYPMVYDNKNRLLKQFQRWVITRLYQHVPWEDYKGRIKEVTLDEPKTVDLEAKLP